MKKIYILALGVAAMAVTSCGKGEKAADGADTLVSKALSDSISADYGFMAGGFVANELKVYARESGEAYDNKDFIKGVQSVISAEHSEAYLAGISTGLRVMQDIKQMKEQGVQGNQQMILDEMRKQIMADSVDMEQTQLISTRYSSMMQQVSEQAKARQEARKAAEPEAVKNTKTAEAFINKLQKENPKLQKSDSGLYYVLDNPGEGDRIKPTDRVTVNYKGKHLDGKQFDANDAATFVPGQGLIPGFAEGLELLGKGGKATFYIPGNLAYGANGQPYAGIGPMEMLVFEVEVTDVNAPQVK